MDVAALAAGATAGVAGAAGAARVDPAATERRARAAAVLLLTQRGTPFLYQGEELGLWEVEDLPVELLQDPIWVRSGHTDRGRDGCRVPIPWDGDEPPFGFSPPGTSTWLPQPSSWKGLSVGSQLGDAGSMLELYRAALRIRRDEPELGMGELCWRESPSDVLFFERGPNFACVTNISDAVTDLPPHRELLLTSVPLIDGKLPVDATAWIRRAER